MGMEMVMMMVVVFVGGNGVSIVAEVCSIVGSNDQLSPSDGV